MEEERIDAVKNLPELKSIHDIQLFPGFTNFYHCFIQGFRRIVALLTSMLRIRPTSTTPKSMNLVDEFDRGFCGENEARRAFASTKRLIRADYPSSDHVSHAVSNIISNSAKNISGYLNSDAKTAFDQLPQAFTEAPIL